MRPTSSREGRRGIWSPEARRRPWAHRPPPACAEVVISRTEWGALCARDPLTGETWAYHAEQTRTGARWIYRAARRVGAVVTWGAVAGTSAAAGAGLAALIGLG